MSHRAIALGKTGIAALLFLGPILVAVPAASQQILNQDASPINIMEYNVRSMTDANGQRVYLHEVVVQEEMQATVTGAQLMFVENDGFSIQSIHRATLKQEVRFHEQGSGSWSTSGGDGSEFAVLVEKVRFRNGDVWAAGHGDMAAAIRTIDPEFRTARLQDQPQVALVVEVDINVDVNDN